MALQFQRNAKVYVEFTENTAPATATRWQVPVLAGFSFSQSMNSSEITINEAGVTSRRARLLFQDSLAPVEWSMSTYIRPTSVTSPTTASAPEAALWAMLMGGNAYIPTQRVFYSTIAPITAQSPSPTNAKTINTVASTTNTFDFSASNVSSFPAGVNLWVAFVDGSNKEFFQLADVVVNSVTIDFDIEGIATAQWSGFARTIARQSNEPTFITSATFINEGVTSTTNFIRNRLSTVSLARTTTPSQATYDIVLTGGSFSVENNINYLIPEQLGLVNQPIANITGARTISGSLTCYYDNDTAAFKSADLWADLIGDTTNVRNVHDMAVNIGGTTAATPRLTLDLPTAHLEIPTIGVDDLMTLEINFHGIVANGNVDNTDEATIIYNV